MSNGRGRAFAWLAVGLLVAMMLGLWWLRPAKQSSSSGAALEPAPGAATVASASSPIVTGALTAGDSPPRTKRGGVRPITPEAERLRARVLESLGSRQREPARERTASASTGTGGMMAAREPTPGTMVDRTGELGKDAMRVINHEFMPLVGECYDQARERNPRLRGMLAVNIELAGAEDVGGSIIETVEEATDLNELHDDELIECVRQSAFSIQLPAPVKSGRTARQLTMPFGDPQPDAGR